MNKLSIIGMLLLGSLCTTACQKESEDVSLPTPNFSIVEAQSYIPVMGGEIAVTTDQAPAKAYASDSWLNVSLSGNKVSLSADANEAIESRNTLLVLKDAKGDSITLNIKQEGIIFGLPHEQAMIGGDAAINREIKVSANVPTTYTATEDWINVTTANGILNVNVPQNATGRPRTAYIVASGAGRLDSLQVTQASLADIVGTYTQTALMLEGTEMVERTSQVEIRRVSNTQARFIIDGELEWNVTFTPGVGLQLMNGQVVKTTTGDRGQTVYLVSVLAADDFTNEHKNTIIGTREPVRLDIKPDGTLVFEEGQRLASEQRWASYGFATSSSRQLTQGTYQGIERVYIQPKLVRNN